MWQSQTELLDAGNVHRYSLFRDQTPVSYSDVLSLWRDNESFRSWFIRLLADSPFKAFRWETPAVTTDTLNRDFEFVLLRNDSLSRRVDATAFADYFDSSLEVVTFPNLGGDALLVVPCPMGDSSIYGHLAAFVRGAPESQLHCLWESVARAMMQRVCDRPVWLSTAGMGVSWLHVRLDDRPKYYGYRPFCARP